MDVRDSEKIIQLAREGKQISKIWSEDFPQYNHWLWYLYNNNEYYSLVSYNY